MTEAEILSQFNFAEERVWVLLQWWAGISIGLIALAHVAARKLNLVLLSLILILYFSYSVGVYSVVGNVFERMAASVEDLRAISAEDLSATSQVLLETYGPSLARGFGLTGAGLGLLLGSIFYPVYCFWAARSRRAKTPESE